MIRIVIVQDSWCTWAGLSLGSLSFCLLDQFSVSFLPQIEAGSEVRGWVSLSLHPQGLAWSMAYSWRSHGYR